MDLQNTLKKHVMQLKDNPRTLRSISTSHVINKKLDGKAENVIRHLLTHHPEYKQKPLQTYRQRVYKFEVVNTEERPS